MRLIAGREFLAGDENDRGIGEQGVAFDSKFVQASFCQVRGVGLQLGGGCLQLAAAVAGLIEKLAGVAEKLVDFGEAGPELIFFKLQQAFASLACVALGCEVGGLLLEL